LKSIVKILTVLIVSAYLILVLGFIDKQYEGVLCNGVNVIVQDSLERGLISAADVKSLVQLDHPGIAGMPITSLDVAGIEDGLKIIPAISNAQVYTNIQGRLMIEITQRSPVARIEDSDHHHYYLDREGYVIPASMTYTPHILHINGEIPGSFSKEIKIVESGAGERDRQLMEDVLEMANYIHADPFWRSQIVQVYVNARGEFELVPRVGSQIIIFGGADQIETKFFKLNALYREGFSHTGWNQYEMINLKYKNQVICTKR